MKTASKKITEMLSTRLQRDFLWKMMNKSNKKILLKRKQANLNNAKNHQILGNYFEFWLRKFSALKMKENKITQKHTRLIK